MQLNLTQARRVEREIGKELDNETQGTARSNLAVSVYEDLPQKVNAAQLTLLADLAKVSALAAIRFSIRKAIETQNEQAGLNALMNREAELKYMAGVYAALTITELDNKNLDIAFQRHAAAKAAVEKGTPIGNRYGQPTDEIQLDSIVRTETMEKLRGEAKSIQRELVATSAKLATLNATTKVELSAEDAERLEEYGIVL